MKIDRNVEYIIGLGNPHMSYTRHNVGFDFLNMLSSEWKTKASCLLSSIIINNRKLILVKPMNYMNHSGEAILKVVPHDTSKFIVIHDDMETPFKSIKVRTNASHKGHNGIRSIHNLYGSNYMRICIGIGRPDERQAVSDYVVSRFTPEELLMLYDVFNKLKEDIYSTLQTS